MNPLVGIAGGLHFLQLLGYLVVALEALLLILREVHVSGGYE